MQNTMRNVPLTTATILRHGSSVHGSASIRTLQPTEPSTLASPQNRLPTPATTPKTSRDRR